MSESRILLPDHIVRIVVKVGDESTTHAFRADGLPCVIEGAEQVTPFKDWVARRGLHKALLSSVEDYELASATFSRPGALEFLLETALSEGQLQDALDAQRERRERMAAEVKALREAGKL